MNVYDYFKLQMGRAPSDESLDALPVNSPCGLSCVDAINAGRRMIDEHKNAFGEHRPDDVAHLERITDEIIECLWRG